jgi:hypothetical protein|tara:strand:- start:144 stop:320 length:177 start_codon:yes stop_codon:yes gene_type:complete
MQEQEEPEVVQVLIAPMVVAEVAVSAYWAKAQAAQEELPLPEAGAEAEALMVWLRPHL